MRSKFLLAIIAITLVSCINSPAPNLRSPCVAIDSDHSSGNPCIRRPLNADKFLT